MRCVVYKSRRRADTFLYLRADLQPTDLPAAVAEMLGALQRVIDLDLVPGRTLAREDPAVVRANLASSGFHIQFPPGMVTPA